MTSKLPAPLEKDIQRAILQYLAARGVFAWRVNSGAMTGTHNGKTRFMRFNGAEGCSDILGILPGGRFVAVEVKRPGKKPTGVQQAFLDRVNQSGGMGFVATSIADVERALEAVQ